MLLLLLDSNQFTFQGVNESVIIVPFVQEQTQFFFHGFHLSLQNLHSAGMPVASELQLCYATCEQKCAK